MEKHTYPCIKLCTTSDHLLLIYFTGRNKGHVLLDQSQHSPHPFLFHSYTWDEEMFELVTDPITLTFTNTQ
jgi:hypothetical protein